MNEPTRGRWLLLAAALIVLASGLILTPPAAAQQEGVFSGAWTASGKWQPLDFKNGREVFTFRLAGHVNLKTDLGKVRDFWGECIGLRDAGTGSTARCVWKQPGSKNEAYLVLHGRIAEENVRLNGEFVGGAGNLQGLSGTVSFTWWSVVRNRTDHILTGYAEDLKGSYQILNPAQ